MKLFAIFLSGLLLTGCDPNAIKLANCISKSTVLVQIKVIRDDGKTRMGTCSSVTINEGYDILLANHCIAVPEGIKIYKIWIRNFDGRSQEAKVLRNSPKTDLALLGVLQKEYPARIARKQPSVGSVAWVVGSPLGIEWVVSKGIVSRVGLEMERVPGATFFVTDATILPGNSGGGVWNDRGELIGIVSMSTSVLGGLGAAGLGFIVDVETVRKFLK